MGQAERETVNAGVLLEFLVFPGNWSVQASSPFFPDIPETNNFATITELDFTNVVAQEDPVAGAEEGEAAVLVVTASGWRSSPPGTRTS